MQLITNVKKYKKEVLTLILIVFCMPLIEVLTKIIFTYGNIVGTFIRNVLENGICF